MSGPGRKGPARDPRGKAALARYNWIEKTLTACAVTLGYALGEAPVRLLVLITLTNWLWIPLILWADVRLRRSLAAGTGTPSRAIEISS